MEQHEIQKNTVRMETQIKHRYVDFDGVFADLICCPVCGYINNHFGPCIKLKDCLIVYFWCELGHEWYLNIAFHKGESSIYASIIDYQTMPYEDYLKTDRWKETAREAKERAGHRCQLCNSPDRLEVHHRTYERRGNELPQDLIVLCRDCHARFHDKLPSPQLVADGD